MYLGRCSRPRYGPADSACSQTLQVKMLLTVVRNPPDDVKERRSCEAKARGVRAVRSRHRQPRARALREAGAEVLSGLDALGRRSCAYAVLRRAPPLRACKPERQCLSPALRCRRGAALSAATSVQRNKSLLLCLTASSPPCPDSDRDRRSRRRRREWPMAVVEASVVSAGDCPAGSVSAWRGLVGRIGNRLQRPDDPSRCPLR